MLIVDDRCLGMDRELLVNFLVCYARFEYAVKAAGLHKQPHGYAEPDWDALARAVGAGWAADATGELERHLRYLEQNPPKQLKKVGDELRWETRSHDRWQVWDASRRALFLIQGVRNNVAHGSKFIPGNAPTVNRNRKLVTAALAVIEAILDASATAANDGRMADVRERFHAPYE